MPRGPAAAVWVVADDGAPQEVQNTPSTPEGVQRSLSTSVAVQPVPLFPPLLFSDRAVVSYVPEGNVQRCASMAGMHLPIGELLVEVGRAPVANTIPLEVQVR